MQATTTKNQKGIWRGRTGWLESTGAAHEIWATADRELEAIHHLFIISGGANAGNLRRGRVAEAGAAAVVRAHLLNSTSR